MLLRRRHIENVIKEDAKNTKEVEEVKAPKVEVKKDVEPRKTKKTD